VKPAIIFPDAMLAVIEALKLKLETVSAEHVTTYTIGTRVPGDKSLDKSTLPYILVRLDGSSLSRVVDETATIRIAVWHSSESKGLALAGVLRALLLSYEGDSKIRAIQSLTGTVPASDPESGEPLSSFTVAVHLRPITL
jgi:hypothetical protein